MKKLMIALSVFAALLLTSCGKKQNANGWFTNFEDAKKVAQSKDKAILLFVNSDMDATGSEKGVETVLSKDFVDLVSDRYVCVHFDFTDISSVFSDAEKEISSKEQKALEKRAAELTEQFKVADEYGIQTTPIFNILTKEGYYVTEPACEFSSNSAEGYAGAVGVEDALVSEYNERVAATKKGSALEKVAAIDSLYKDAAEIHHVAMYDLVKKLVSLDPKNKSGLLGEYYFQLANLEAYKKIIDQDTAGAVRVYTEYAEHKAIEPLDSQTLYYLAAQLSSRLPETEAADLLELLEKSINAAPESEYVGTIEQIRDSVEKMLKTSDVPAEAVSDAETSSAE